MTRQTAETAVFDPAAFGAALASVHNTIVFSSNDWSSARDFAWLYGIIVGWDNDDDPDLPATAMEGLADRHRWTAENVAELRRLHAAYAGFDYRLLAKLLRAAEAMDKTTDQLAREIRTLRMSERMATRHAITKDAEIAEAEAKLARREADLAQLRAAAAQHTRDMFEVKRVLDDVRELVDVDGRTIDAAAMRTLLDNAGDGDL